MKLIILGSGTGVPSLRRSAPCYFLENQGHEFLVDCGGGSVLQLERAGGSYKTIDVVFFTHIHPDHVNDLIPLIHALKVTPGFKREKPLRLLGPRDFPEFFHRCIQPVVGTPKHFDLEVGEVEATFEYAGLGCSTVATVHSEHLHSVAYRFEQGERSLVLSGDCDYAPGIIAFSRGAEVLVVDCSFPQALKVEGHLSGMECGQVAAGAGVGRLILSHLYPVPQGEDTRLQEARTAFPGRVELAEDLMEIDI